ncbi:MAG: aldo/keto reductase [Planctomycetes bacterium]|nr:aldo/keto reductase [Planctomycetota bacterium]
MSEKQNQFDRRNFLKAAGAAGLSSVLVSTGRTNAEEKPQKPKYPQVPKRKLGKLKVEIPYLSFGTFQVDVENQILLRKTLQYGVNFWDTAYNYGGGNSELGIGKFLTKNKNARKNLFLVTKASGARSPKEIEKRLKTSLERMNTNYIDLYYGLHQCSNPAWLTDNVKKWAESAKKRKLIRHFGITTHDNMSKVLAAAAKLPWIEVIMTPFNFYQMQDPEMQAAVDACHKAGIGLIAMKTLGTGQKIKTDADKKLVEHFLQRGFTKEQAKIKLVLEDKRFSSACVGMKNISVLNSNLAVAFDKTKLTQADREVFNQYAKATCDGYCAGCADICNSALDKVSYVSDIMRYLMYHNSYGEQAEAKRLFARIPAGVRNKLLDTDYSLAEARCPQRLPIRELITEAVSKLA